MQLELIISSIQPSMIIINNKYTYFYDDNKKIRIKIDFQTHFYITIHTIGDHSNPYTIRLDYINNKLSSSGAVHIIKHTKKIYELVLLNNTQVPLQTHTLKNQWIIINNKNIKVFEKSNLLLNTQLNNHYPNSKVEVLQKNIFIKSKASKGYNICIIDNKMTVYEFSNVDFSIKDNEIKIAKHHNDYAQHVTVEVFSLDPLQKKERYLAYPKKPKMYTNKNVIPYAFMVNILANDYKEATEYLDNSLKDSLKKEHLRLFFGDFIQISVPKIKSDTNDITLIYHEKENFFSTKTFIFEIENNKIINIDEKNEAF